MHVDRDLTRLSIGESIAADFRRCFGGLAFGGINVTALESDLIALGKSPFAHIEIKMGIVRNRFG